MVYPRDLRPLLRWLVRAVAIILIFVAVGCIAIYASAKLFEHRAEMLCAHIKALRVGGSTFHDVQRLSEEYHRTVAFEGEECSAEHCGFTIFLKNEPFPVFNNAPAMWRFGIRSAKAAATLRVSNGKLRYASFAIGTRTQYGYWLEASFHAVPCLSMFDKCSHDNLGRDSTYIVTHAHLTNGDGGGAGIRTAFAVEATDDRIRKGTDISFSCITARPSCRTTSDLMPEADRDVSFELNRDRLFTKECQDYVKKVEVGSGPWTLDNSFAPDPISVIGWSLTRPTD
jgi:hypothetical protein